MKKLDTFSKQVDKHLKKLDMLGLGKSEVYLENVHYHGLEDIYPYTNNKILKKENRYRRHIYQLFHIYFSDQDAKDLLKKLIVYHLRLKKENPQQTFKQTILQWKSENLEYWKAALERKEEDPDLSLFKKLRNAWLTISGKIVISSAVFLMLFLSWRIFVFFFVTPYKSGFNPSNDYKNFKKICVYESDTADDVKNISINFDTLRFRRQKNLNLYEQYHENKKTRFSSKEVLSSLKKISRFQITKNYIYAMQYNKLGFDYLFSLKMVNSKTFNIKFLAYLKDGKEFGPCNKEKNQIMFRAKGISAKGQKSLKYKDGLGQIYAINLTNPKIKMVCSILGNYYEGKVMLYYGRNISIYNSDNGFIIHDHAENKSMYSLSTKVYRVFFLNKVMYIHTSILGTVGIFRIDGNNEKFVLSMDKKTSFVRSGTKIYSCRGALRYNGWSKLKNKLGKPGIKVQCFDLHSQKSFWKRKINVSKIWGKPVPILIKEKMLICLYNKLFILNRRTGKTLKIIKLPFPVESKPVIFQNQLFYYGETKMIIIGNSSK